MSMSILPTAPTSVVPRSPFERLKWSVADAWTITLRDLTRWIRMPEQVIGGLLYPIISVLLFGFVFGSAMVVPGGGNYREFLMPGLFAMTMAFGIGATAVAVVTDTARGVTDRFRSIPMSRSAVVTGRSAADMISALFDLTALVLCGLVVGWRWRGSIGEALAAVGLLLLLRFAFIWVGIYIGLLVRTPESANHVFSLIFPLSMVANTFVAPELMPTWLGIIAEWNPLSATVAATRELFGNPGMGGDSWVTQNAILMAIFWPVFLIGIFCPLSVRRYQRLSR